MFRDMTVGVVMPALNEEESIETVVSGLLRQFDDLGERIVDKLIVCDNGSSDNTARLAEAAGATVVYEQSRGYGIACQKALGAMDSFDPDVVVFTDADNAFEPGAILDLLAPMDSGFDLVVGSRTLGRAERGALSLSQRTGNRVATLLIRWLWGARFTDLGPYRAIRSASLRALEMRDETFGWTVEMQVKAIQRGLRVTEVPVRTRVRIGESKISGTLRGAVGAGIGILSMIFALWLEQRHGATPIRHQ